MPDLQFDAGSGTAFLSERFLGKEYTLVTACQSVEEEDERKILPPFHPGSNPGFDIIDQ